jgi:DNA polymerase
MSIDHALLTRFLAQLQELGGRELYLDSLTAVEFTRGLRESRLPRRFPASDDVAGGPGDAAEDGSHAQDVSVASPPVAAAVRGAAGTREALRVLAEVASGCTRCRLHESRRTVVFGEGDPGARLVIVGEAPGQDEDRTGRPFVGRAGRMLDLLLLTAGFPRESVFICNVLKCRPPGNRDPLPDEVAICTSNFLHPQIEAIRPRVMLAVGRFAAQALLRTEEGITRLRGRVHEYRGTPLVVTYHPAFLLRTPHMTRTAWDDIQLMRRVFDEHQV